MTRDPVCPRCAGVIRPGDHVLYGHGELIHLKCRVAAEVIAEFLKRRNGDFSCQTCLSRSLDLDWEDIQKGVAQLKSEEHLGSAVVPCARCGQRRLSLAIP